MTSCGRFASLASILVLASAGCNSLGITTGPRLAGLRDLNENPQFYEQRTKQESCPSCGETECECESKRWTIAWYEEQAQKPIGARQHYRMGKLWPPQPRPIGENPEISHRYHAAHYWPWPYKCQDRKYFKTVAHAQENNGWITETTLYDYHFDRESHELTEAGKLHLKWILLHVPEENRVAWVQTATDSEISRKRVASVKEVALAMAGEEKLLPIMLRATTPVGGSAEEAVSIQRAWFQSMPEPRILYTPLPTGTGS